MYNSRLSAAVKMVTCIFFVENYLGWCKILCETCLVQQPIILPSPWCVSVRERAIIFPKCQYTWMVLLAYFRFFIKKVFKHMMLCINLISLADNEKWPLIQYMKELWMLDSTHDSIDIYMLKLLLLYYQVSMNHEKYFTQLPRSELIVYVRMTTWDHMTKLDLYPNVIPVFVSWCIRMLFERLYMMASPSGWSYQHFVKLKVLTNHGIIWYSCGIHLIGY